MRSILLSIIIIAAFGGLAAQDVHQYPGGEASLGSRWKWALDEVSHSGNRKDFWIGYSIKRLMDEDSYILSGSVFSGSVSSRISLYDELQMTKPEGVSKNPGSRSNADRSIFKRMKDVAILFLCSTTPSGESSIQKVEICNMELSIDLKKNPVFWIGWTDDEQSVQRLAELYKTVSLPAAKKRFVEAIGIHQQSKKVYPFLSDLLKSSDPDEVRANAAFWLSEQHNPDALSLLMNVAQTDRSTKVREQAVFPISQIDDEASTDALITLVRKADDSKVRAKAAFWLGQKASQKALATLDDIIASDDETDVQRQALYALSQEKNKEGTDRLIRIAKTHPNPRIRKQAIQILGQSDDSRALEALIEIVRK